MEKVKLKKLVRNVMVKAKSDIVISFSIKRGDKIYFLRIYYDA